MNQLRRLLPTLLSDIVLYTQGYLPHTAKKLYMTAYSILFFSALQENKSVLALTRNGNWDK